MHKAGYLERLHPTDRIEIMVVSVDEDFDLTRAKFPSSGSDAEGLELDLAGKRDVD